MRFFNIFFALMLAVCLFFLVTDGPGSGMVLVVVAFVALLLVGNAVNYYNRRTK